MPEQWWLAWSKRTSTLPTAWVLLLGYMMRASRCPGASAGCPRAAFSPVGPVISLIIMHVYT